MRDGFAEYHPIVNMLFFVAVIGTAMFVMHPIYTVISFVAAAVYQVYLKGKKGLLFVVTMIPVFLLTSLINPLFSHKGMTLICYLPTGNPLTLESVVYGMASGLMIVTVILWFSTFNSIMTSDKILWVTGKIFPSLGMMISMVLRFIPKFTRQLQKVIRANKALGIEVTGPFAPVRDGMRVFGIMVSWSLENSVITADSMRARGYGSGKRTGFSLYSITNRDKLMFFLMTMLLIWDIGVVAIGRVHYSFYPIFRLENVKGVGEQILTYGVHGIFCFLPIIIDLKEDVKWHRLQSKI